MFIAYNYFRRHNDGKEINDYKEFYKYISGSLEFGGEFTNLDHMVAKRFSGLFGHVYNTFLRKLPSKVLDIGCGNGTNLPLASIFKNVQYYGIDYSEKTIEEARRTHPNVKFDVMDAFNLEFADNSFDMVISSFMVMLYGKEEDRVCLLKEARRVMKNDGILIFITISENFALKSSIRLSRVLARINKIALPEDFESVHLSDCDVMRMAQKAGLVRSDRIKTASLQGLLFCVRYLTLSRYKRKFGKSESEIGKQKINILKDLEAMGNNKLLINTFYLMHKIFPKIFSMCSIYIFSKK